MALVLCGFVAHRLVGGHERHFADLVAPEHKDIQQTSRCASYASLSMTHSLSSSSNPPFMMIVALRKTYAHGIEMGG